MPDYSDRFENVFVHDFSYVDDGVEIGAGTKIRHFSHILGGTLVGANCSFGQDVVVGPLGRATHSAKNNIAIFSQ